MKPRGHLWGLRVLALGLALILWFALSFQRRESRSEKQVQASVTYMRGDEMVILDPRQTVDLTLSGPRETINRVNPFDVSVQVDLRQAEPGTHEVNLSAENVSLPQGLRVDRLQPSSVEVTVDRLVRRELPVEPDVRGEPAAGATRGEVEVVPPVVVVTGPESQLQNLSSLKTAVVSLEGHALSFEESAPVIAPENVAIREIEPSRVNVRVPLRVASPGEDQESPPRRSDRRPNR
ncbi:MAG TPA: CdaR family protein [Thermoanaerobaculia bacterium]